MKGTERSTPQKKDALHDQVELMRCFVAILMFDSWFEEVAQAIALGLTESPVSLEGVSDICSVQGRSDVGFRLNV